MKKTFVTLASAMVLAAAMPSVSLAQASAVTNAVLNQRSGLLDKARVDIDKAIVHEKTSGKAKTWYTRGEIYEGMLTSPIYGKQLQPGEGIQKAFESYNKTVELDTKTGEFGKLAVGKMDNLYGQAFNDAVASYNAKEYDKAIASYKLASQIRPQDTTAVLYSAYASEAKQDFAAARASYNQLLGMNYKSANLYGRLLQMARQEKNEAEATKVLQQALAAYPSNKTFLLEDLNIALAAGRGPEAIEKIKRSIAVDPNNSNLHTVLGSVYDKNKQPELALQAYNKAIELDPKNFDAQYNVGVYYFNKGADIFKVVNKMDLKTYQVKGKKLEADAKKLMEQAIPHFEAALLVNPKEAGVQGALRKAYSSVGRKADADKLTK